MAAFFDVDNTLVHGTTLFHLARALRRRGFFRSEDLIRFAGHQLRYTALGELNNLEKVRDQALGLLAGHDAAELAGAAEEVYQDVLAGRLYPEVMGLLAAHRAAGHQVWLVTASPVEIAQVLATHLGATGCLATVAERSEGRYTGRLLGEAMHGETKAHAIQELAEQAGLDLTASYAYGDSGNDLPVLRIVGHPVAVNPDRRLRRAATSNGWPRYDFRVARRVAVRGIGALVAAATVWGTTAAVRAWLRRG